MHGWSKLQTLKNVVLVRKNATSSAVVPQPPKEVAKSLESHSGKQYEIHKTFQESVFFPNGTVKSNNLLIDKGLYIDHLEYWLKSFPPDRLLLLDGEKFVSDPGPTLRSVEEFLGIRHYFTKDHFYFDQEKHFFCLRKPFRNCMSDSKGREHPQVSDDVLKKLREFYRPYNEKLARYLNTTLLWNSLWYTHLVNMYRPFAHIPKYALNVAIIRGICRGYQLRKLSKLRRWHLVLNLRSRILFATEFKCIWGYL